MIVTLMGDFVKEIKLYKEKSRSFRRKLRGTSIKEQVKYCNFV